jgi:hypothetical protein
MELAELPGSEGYVILKENWKPEIAEAARKQTFKDWVFNNKPDVFRVLDLGMRDPSIQVQNWTMQCLRQLAFVDFSDDFTSYPAWYKDHVGKSAHDIQTEGILNTLRAIKESAGAARDREFRALARIRSLKETDPSPAVFAASQFQFDAENLSQDGETALAALVHYEKPSQDFMKTKVVAWLGSPRPDRQSLGLQAIIGSPGAYAFEPLRKYLGYALKSQDTDGMMFQIGMAFDALHDLRAIQLLIGAIDADDNYQTVYGLGYFGPSKLTGVEYDKSNNGAWWRSWWDKNRQGFPKSIQDTPIPGIW